MDLAIKTYVDKAFVDHNYDICIKEARRLFGEHLTIIDRCSEEEFKHWYEKNNFKIPYTELCYDVAKFIWDEEDTFFAP